MSDLISRQKAKDAIDMALDHIDHVPSWVYDKLLNALNKVPSVQPTHPTPSNTLGALDVNGLEEEIRCTMCKNPMHTDRGCDGNCKYDEKLYERIIQILGERIKPLPPAQPERLTDDDFETIRIHLNAQKENLCNQRRWKEAEEYQRIIDRFMALASVQPRRGKWIGYKADDKDWQRDDGSPVFMNCSECHEAVINNGSAHWNFCPNCGSYNGGDVDE